MSGQKHRGWGLGDKSLPPADAFQHHSLNLSCGSRKPTNLERKFFFWRIEAGTSMKTKGRTSRGRERSRNVYENKGT